ncbi:MAG TPA: hypothetical protein VN372_05320 [Methanospirillum sp.]|nr:hypothetical protein [Methanospirillum sp.]
MSEVASTYVDRTTLRLTPYHRGLAEKMVPNFYPSLNAAICASLEKEAIRKGIVVENEVTPNV